MGACYRRRPEQLPQTQHPSARVGFDRPQGKLGKLGNLALRHASVDREFQNLALFRPELPRKEIPFIHV